MALFPSLKQNFYCISFLPKCPHVSDCIFEIHQLWQIRLLIRCIPMAAVAIHLNLKSCKLVSHLIRCISITYYLFQESTTIFKCLYKKRLENLLKAPRTFFFYRGQWQMSIVFANGSGGPGFNPRSSHTKDSKNVHLIPPSLTLSIIRYESRVKRSKPGKGIVTFPTPQCCSFWKRERLGHPRLWSANFKKKIIYICIDGSKKLSKIQQYREKIDNNVNPSRRDF